MKPSRETDKRFGRDVRQILDASKVGVMLGDNFGELVTYRHNSDRLPIRVPVKLRAEPLAVLVARVVTTDGGDGFRASGNRIGWYWRSGEVEVSNLDDVTASTDYDVTLVLMKGPN